MAVSDVDDQGNFGQTFGCRKLTSERFYLQCMGAMRSGARDATCVRFIAPAYGELSSHGAACARDLIAKFPLRKASNTTRMEASKNTA